MGHIWFRVTWHLIFPKIKRTLISLLSPRFTSIGDIKCAPLKELKDIPKIEFEICLDNWKNGWYKCIISSGNYFEGDNTNDKRKTIFFQIWKFFVYAYIYFHNFLDCLQIWIFYLYNFHAFTIPYIPTWRMNNFPFL